MTTPEPIVIAIDGPGGVGKSTVARRLATRLRLPYLNTGAMYRALGYEVVSRGIDPEAYDVVAALAADIDLQVGHAADGSVEILLNGEPLGERIRDERVGQVTSQIAAYPGVRRRMVSLQRRVGRESGGVIEGRDIGTKVFPETPYKFFLDAEPQVRALRRHREISDRRGPEVSLDAVRLEMDRRDRRDAGRADSPLRKDSTYVVIDTTRLSADEVVEEILAVVQSISADGATPVESD